MPAEGFCWAQLLVFRTFMLVLVFVSVFPLAIDALILTKSLLPRCSWMVTTHQSRTSRFVATATLLDESGCREGGMEMSMDVQAWFVLCFMSYTHSFQEIFWRRRLQGGIWGLLFLVHGQVILELTPGTEAIILVDYSNRFIWWPNEPAGGTVLSTNNVIIGQVKCFRRMARCWAIAPDVEYSKHFPTLAPWLTGCESGISCAQCSFPADILVFFLILGFASNSNKTLLGCRFCGIQCLSHFLVSLHMSHYAYARWWLHVTELVGTLGASRLQDWRMHRWDRFDCALGSYDNRLSICLVISRPLVVE